MNTLEDTSNQERTSLPGGWETVPLLELGDLIRGVTYKKQDASIEPFTDSIPILRANNIQNGNLDQEELVHIPRNLVLDIQLITKGDILIATSSGSISVVGKAARAQNDTNTAFGAFCGLIRPRPEISSRYLGHYFGSQGYRQRASAMARGVNINNLKKAHFESLSVNLPPLNEQRRIADKLDTTLTAVEACKQKLNNAAETIQRFRQSVLAAAVSGGLTKNQNQFTEKQISDVCTVVRGASPRPAGDPRYFTDDPEIPWITVGELTKDEEKYLERTKTFLTEEGKERSRLINEKTLLLTNSGATLGVPKITLISGCINDGSVALEGLDEPLKSYLYYVLKSKTQELRNIKQGAAQPNLNTTIVKNIRFSCPDDKEGQTEAINKIETLFELADLIEKQIVQAKSQIDAIRNSVLDKAFRGELVPQDPNDEPASVLLERIKALRETEAAAKKTAKRGRKKKAAAAQLVIPEGIADNHLAKVLEECGALSERALLAASELEPGVFQLQLSKELGAGGLKQVDVDGEAAYADASWEEEG